jgi:hypothetical protein
MGGRRHRCRRARRRRGTDRPPTEVATIRSNSHGAYRLGIGTCGRPGARSSSCGWKRGSCGRR